MPFRCFGRARTAERQHSLTAEQHAPFARLGPTDELRNDVVRLHGREASAIAAPNLAFVRCSLRQLGSGDRGFLAESRNADLVPCYVPRVAHQLFRLTTGFAGAAVMAFAVARSTASAAAPPSCEALAHVALPDTTISAAENVPGPSFTPPGGTPLEGLPAFCRVAAVTRPAVKF